MYEKNEMCRGTRLLRGCTNKQDGGFTIHHSNGFMKLNMLKYIKYADRINVPYCARV